MRHPNPRLAFSALLLLCACAATPERATSDRIWHVKAVRPDGSFVDVKALDGDRILDVKALETPGNLHLMDVKALRDGARLDVKLVSGSGDRAPLRAITPDGVVLEIAALPREGGRLAVAGIRRDGNLFHVKAIEADGSVLAVKAISPDGHLMDVKGLAFGGQPIEATIHGAAVAAHVKAIPQTTEPEDAAPRRWRVRAIHPDGGTLVVQAVGADGAACPLEAIEVAGNPHVMDIKAIRDGVRLAVKVREPLGSDAVLVAITPAGELLDVRAVAAGMAPLEVRAVARDGNVLHVKAIGPDGRHYGVKALSDEGFLRDVKGLKLLDDDVEDREAGVPYHAHVKALPQVLGVGH